METIVATFGLVLIMAMGAFVVYCGNAASKRSIYRSGLITFHQKDHPRAFAGAIWILRLVGLIMMAGGAVGIVAIAYGWVNLAPKPP